MKMNRLPAQESFGSEIGLCLDLRSTEQDGFGAYGYMAKKNQIAYSVSTDTHYLCSIL